MTYVETLDSLLTTSFLIQIHLLYIKLHQIKLEKDKDFLYIYEGGSQKGKMIANMTGKKIDTHISIPGNQMYIEFHTNGNIEGKGFYAKILESMYLFCFSSIF